MIDGSVVKIEQIVKIYPDSDDVFTQVTINVRSKYFPCLPYCRYSAYEKHAVEPKEEYFKDPDFLKKLDQWSELLSQYYTEIEDLEYQRELLEKLHLGKIKILQVVENDREE